MRKEYTSNSIFATIEEYFHAYFVGLTKPVACNLIRLIIAFLAPGGAPFHALAV